MMRKVTEYSSTNRIVVEIIAVLEERHADRLSQIRCSNQTRLGADLDLSSIDTIQVFAAVDARLGIQMPYDRLLARAEPVTDLSIGELAYFIEENGGVGRTVDVSGEKSPSVEVGGAEI